LSRSTAYHPQSDGQSEIMNRFLNDYLRNFCVEHSDWLQHLKVAEFAYNNSTHGSTQYSPFFLNYGQHPNTPVQQISPSASASSGSAGAFAANMDRILITLKLACFLLKSANSAMLMHIALMCIIKSVIWYY
jgi:hypothetical protein